MNILLARHGETPWNAEGRYQGQVDIPLSEVGISQATALGQRLHALRIESLRPAHPRWSFPVPEKRFIISY